MGPRSPDLLAFDAHTLMTRSNEPLMGVTEDTYVEFEAIVDVLVAISACPDLTVGGKEIGVEFLA